MLTNRQTSDFSRRTKQFAESSQMTKRFKNRKHRGLVIILLLSSSMNISCGRFTDLSIEGGNPPSFTFSVNGKLTSISFNGPDKELEDKRTSSGEPPHWKIYWEIIPRGVDPRKLRQSTPIIYGKVPAGYVQISPKAGAPPPLSEGETYSLKLSVEGGDGSNTLFRIIDGKVASEEN